MSWAIRVGITGGRFQKGDLELNSTGNVLSQGQNSFSHSDIEAAVHGDQKGVNSFQQGSASGTGDTQAQAVGGAVMSENGVVSPTSESGETIPRGIEYR